MRLFLITDCLSIRGHWMLKIPGLIDRVYEIDVHAFCVHRVLSLARQTLIYKLTGKWQFVLRYLLVIQLSIYIYVCCFTCNFIYWAWCIGLLLHVVLLSTMGSFTCFTTKNMFIRNSSNSWESYIFAVYSNTLFQHASWYCFTMLNECLIIH